MPRSSFRATGAPGSGAVFRMWRDGASTDFLSQDIVSGEEVVSSHMLKHEAVPVNSVQDVCVNMQMQCSGNCCNVVLTLMMSP